MGASKSNAPNALSTYIDNLSTSVRLTAWLGTRRCDCRERGCVGHRDAGPR